jgi:hypothetical protein
MAQTALTQCYNCQGFGRIWVHSKQPQDAYCAGMAIDAWGARRETMKPENRSVAIATAAST